jgi:dephospho-CoA kinase
MILGITGGMGCGKSTVARLFEERGYCRLDSDALVRSRVFPSPDFQTIIRERYGDLVFTPAGEVDRAALAARIFADDGERRWVEGQVHPRVFAAWRTAIAADPGKNWAVESPLLFEGGIEIWFDFTVCVACSPEQQLVRLEHRGLARALAEQRISKQLPLTRKIELADFVLWNDGSADFLNDQVSRLVDALQTLARTP